MQTVHAKTYPYARPTFSHTNGDTSGLAKQGNNYFRAADPAVAPTAASGVDVQQGKLEGSNVGSAESAVRLVNVMRQFEMLHKAISIGVEMNKKAMEEVARVGS